MSTAAVTQHYRHTVDVLSGKFFLKSLIELRMKGTRYVRTLLRASSVSFRKAIMIPTMTVLARRSSESEQSVIIYDTCTHARTHARTHRAYIKELRLTFRMTSLNISGLSLFVWSASRVSWLSTTSFFISFTCPLT